ncbi:glycoside hydrolase family 36 protein [Jatrophihabitans sp.]|uniref:glycoside hydrolase family 36 protein n=1 Tax=Jatrophihabitans sp. TaxID=1932789 RepID=UPI002CF980B5|nr:glycoside hydrolase family 36 protein [Jatrophihabitans sp.]
MDQQHVLTLEVSSRHARIYEEGWQSWSPSQSYSVAEQPARAASALNYRGGYGGTRPMPDPGNFSGEGLLALDPGTGSRIVVIGAGSAADAVPRITARHIGDEVAVWADGEVLVTDHPAEAGIPAALAAFGDRFAGSVPPPRAAPTLWCSWYHYFTGVTQADMTENIAAIAELDLPVEVIQLDDGYQSEIGDWLSLSDRFDSLAEMVARITDTGRRAGIWIAPFLAGARSRLAAEHPDWLVSDADGPVLATSNWNQDNFGLDTTHPGVQAYLAEVFAHFLDLGFDFFKADFLFAGALDGERHSELSPVAAYRQGLREIRQALGDAYLLGCGAPILPSVGLVDAMRVGPDTAPHFEPAGGDLSKPGGRSAIVTSTGRAWQHGRFWVNDPDCLIVRPEVENREALADCIARVGGLRGSSDRIADLDEWGLERTRALLGSAPGPTPLVAAA